MWRVDPENLQVYSLVPAVDEKLIARFIRGQEGRIFFRS